MKNCYRYIVLGAALLAFVSGKPAHAQVLTGSGPNLPFPGPNVPFPGVGITSFAETPYTNFSAVWAPPASASWLGTIAGSGPYPAGNIRPIGATTFDFSGLPLGLLPVGTFFGISDLDQGGGPVEHISLKAYSSFGVEITTPWLNLPASLYLSTTTGGGAPVATDLPGWDWNNIAANTYTFDGGMTPGNPNINLLLLSNQNIAFLDVFRDNQLSNFGLAAPVAAAAVPEPASLAVWILVGIAAFGFRRRVWDLRG